MTAWLRQTRVRLTLAYAATFSVMAAFAAAALWLGITNVEYTAIDDSLAIAARSAQAAVASGGVLAGTNAGDAVGVAEYLFDTHGALLDSTGQGPRADALAAIAARAQGDGAVVLATATIDGVSVRVRASTVRTAGGEPRVLVLTRSRAEADQLVGTAATVVVVGMAVLIVASTVLGYSLAGTALRPVREVVLAARELGEGDLHRRIDLDLPNDEMGQLADTFNAMLARLEKAFDSLQRFTADAAHELRAPLALIRTEAEVTLSRPREAAQYRASLATVLAEAERLGRVADQLLTLARADAGALAPQMNDVDPSALAEDAVRLWQPLAAERSVRLTTALSPGGVVRGDGDLLRRLLDNLMDNALRHSPPGGEVTVGSAPVERGWELSVTDHGPGVPAEARSSIFDRFSRAEKARGRDTGGAGLGLALCAAIARVHNGTIRLDSPEGGGARFVLRLPPPPRQVD